MLFFANWPKIFHDRGLKFWETVAITEFVSHEVEITLSAEAVYDEPNHFVKSEATFNDRTRKIMVRHSYWKFKKKIISKWDNNLCAPLMIWVIFSWYLENEMSNWNNVWSKVSLWAHKFFGYLKEKLFFIRLNKILLVKAENGLKLNY